MHSDAGNNALSSMITYNHFRIAWYAFLKLLEIDYDSGFKCHQCVDQPDIVIMDATSLAFRKDLDLWHDTKQLTTDTVKSGSRLENYAAY